MFYWIGIYTLHPNGPAKLWAAELIFKSTLRSGLSSASGKVMISKSISGGFSRCKAGIINGSSLGRYRNMLFWIFGHRSLRRSDPTIRSFILLFSRRITLAIRYTMQRSIWWRRKERWLIRIVLLKTRRIDFCTIYPFDQTLTTSYLPSIIRHKYLLFRKWEGYARPISHIIVRCRSVATRGKKALFRAGHLFFFPAVFVMEAKWRYPSYTPISSQNTVNIWISIDYGLLTTKFYYFYLDLELIWDVIVWIFNSKLLLSLLVHTGYRTHAKFSSSWGGYQYSQHDVPKSR